MLINQFACVQRSVLCHSPILKFNQRELLNAMFSVRILQLIIFNHQF